MTISAFDIAIGSLFLTFVGVVFSAIGSIKKDTKEAVIEASEMKSSINMLRYRIEQLELTCTQTIKRKDSS